MTFITACLSETEIVEVFSATQRAQMAIGGLVNLPAQTLTLLTGTLRWYRVPCNAFQPSGDGCAPDFTAFRIIDSGHTVAFGDYEAATDAILIDEACMQL